MAIKSIKDMALAGKRVLIRVDFNVPLDENANITDDSRIRAAIPTIKYAVDANAKVIVMSHLGRPKGKVVKSQSLMPIARRLSELLGISVNMAPDCIGPDVQSMVEALPAGEVLMLENLRFHAEEEKNDPAFAKALASLGECYVNDAFATAHRGHASNFGVCDYIKETAAGFLMLEEVQSINRALKDPQRPLAAIVGGAKVSGKLEILENLLDKVDKLIIGGGMAFTFMKAKGMPVGKSLLEEDLVGTAGDIMKDAAARGVEILLPVDIVAAPEFDNNSPKTVVPADKIPDNMLGLDIGPASVKLFSDKIKQSRTVIWNGPMGAFEMPNFAAGTNEVAKALADSGCLSIVGGGDSVSAVNRSGVADRISYISTGGGAWLELLEGKTLPGIAALDK